MGLGPFPVWRVARIMQNEFIWVFLCRPRATWNGVDLHLRWKWRRGSLTMKIVAGALCIVFVVLLLVVACCCLRLLDEQLVNSCPMVRLFTLP